MVRRSHVRCASTTTTTTRRSWGRPCRRCCRRIVPPRDGAILGLARRNQLGRRTVPDKSPPLPFCVCRVVRVAVVEVFLLLLGATSNEEELIGPLGRWQPQRWWEGCWGRLVGSPRRRVLDSARGQWSWWDRRRRQPSSSSLWGLPPPARAAKVAQAAAVPAMAGGDRVAAAAWK